MGTWNGWLIILLTHFRFQFFKRQNMTPFLTVSFAILAQHDAMKKRGERLLFSLSSFLIFYFQLLFMSRLWRRRVPLNSLA
jgi:hypothetical protein